MKCLLGTVCLLVSLLGHSQITGIVVDESGTTLPGAAVFLLPDSIGTSTDLNGRFQFDFPSGEFKLQVSYLSFHVETVRGTAPAVDVRVRMHAKSTVLGNLIVTGEHDHMEDALHTDHLYGSNLRSADRSTLAASLSQLAGVDALKTGVGIGKPVIRGLANQRIVVSDRGIAQQGQQWGSDHGLEIDAYGVERIEVVKGPGSLLHGSDALGGVVRILPAAVPEDGHLSLGIETQFKSNNDHFGGSAWLAGHHGRITYRGRYSRQEFGDYRVPADSFVYVGFALPLFDQRLKNTAGQEQAYEASLGWLGDRSISTLSFNRYELDVGLFAGAVGLPRAFALQQDGDIRDVDFPSQSVRHDKIIFNHRQDLGSATLQLDAGWQQNFRQEFSFPEFHSAGIVDPNEREAIKLDLQTFSLNTHIDQELINDWELTYGISYEHQTNSSAGFEFLLPAYRSQRAGLFLIGTLRKDARERLTLGLRADAGQNATESGIRRVFDSEGNVLDSLTVSALDRWFYNAAASLGYSRILVPERLSLRAHLGKSFRMPHPAEVASNGIHHGTFRHEQGNPDLRSEHGIQLDADLEWEAAGWTVDLAAYFNFFEGFIYLAPSGRLSPLPEAGQIYQYRQQDAIFTGTELTLGKEFEFDLRAELRFAYVYNYNLETGLGLPFTPPANLRIPLNYGRESEGKLISSWNFKFEPRYMFAQNRVDRNEDPTPDAFLLDAGAAISIDPGRDGQTQIQISIQVFNALDSRYLDHLSRYRLIEVPEQGRNWVIGLRMPFDFHLN